MNRECHKLTIDVERERKEQRNNNKIEKEIDETRVNNGQREKSLQTSLHSATEHVK